MFKSLIVLAIVGNLLVLGAQARRDYNRWDYDEPLAGERGRRNDYPPASARTPSYERPNYLDEGPLDDDDSSEDLLDQDYYGPNGDSRFGLGDIVSGVYNVGKSIYHALVPSSNPPPTTPAPAELPKPAPAAALPPPPPQYPYPPQYAYPPPSPYSPQSPYPRPGSYSPPPGFSPSQPSQFQRASPYQTFTIPPNTQVLIWSTGETYFQYHDQPSQFPGASRASLGELMEAQEDRNMGRRRRSRSVKHGGSSTGIALAGSSAPAAPIHFSSKTLVGSPYDTKYQAGFPTSSTIKNQGRYS